MKIIEWQNGKIKMLDQTLLPGEEVFLQLTDIPDICEAIRALRIRGAPAIGVAAAYGLALGANAIESESRDDFLTKLDEVSRTLAATRPTAV
ncbi:MAG: S-methyl-5-thioribose-1-phosphate isomerase, partial [Chloroflexota bacterium]|nr:S-methyl-5-thioribose-1-phosphate isomerase [Chloroflexota bacterium]